jgi:branched-chain amino acid transport system substrate-binding protein
MDRSVRSSRLSRRTALRLGLGAAVGAMAMPLLAACQPATQPGAAPSKEGAKPDEAAKPAAEPQTAPGATSKGGDVNIAALFPLSGELARPGQTCLNACQMAVEEINEAGGVKALGGAKINLISSDLRSDDKVTRTETERILTTNKITAVNGAYASALSLVASEVTEREKVPIITGSITNPLVERGFKYIFQVSPRASQFGEAQVKLAAELAGESKKAAVVFENTAYGTSTSKGVQEQAQKLGLEITLFEAYEKSFTDAGPLVNKIKASGGQVLFPVSYLNDMVLIIKTMKQQNIKIPIVAGGAGPLLPDFVKTFGDDANGVVSISSWNKDLNEDAVAVDKRYEAKFGEFIQEHAGEVYAFMWVLLDAMERAGSAEPDAVREALTKTNLTKGYGAMMPGAKVTFDEKGWNPNVFPLGVQWQQADLVTVYPKEAARAQLIKPS